MSKLIVPLIDKGIVIQIYSDKKKQFFPGKPMTSINALEIVNLFNTKDQLLLKRDNPVVENMFNNILDKIDYGKKTSFANLTLKDLMCDYLPIPTKAIST
jgi:hypothetical protein